MENEGASSPGPPESPTQPDERRPTFSLVRPSLCAQLLVQGCMKRTHSHPAPSADPECPLGHLTNPPHPLLGVGRCPQLSVSDSDSPRLWFLAIRMNLSTDQASACQLQFVARAWKEPLPEAASHYMQRPHMLCPPESRHPGLVPVCDVHS